VITHIDSGNVITGIRESVMIVANRASAAPWHPAQWAIWTAPRPVRLYYLVIEAAAVVLMVVIWSPSVSRGDWAVFGVLTALEVTETELAKRVERARKHLTDVVHIDLTSVWVLPGALLLPVQLTAILVAVIYGHLWARIYGPTGVRELYRVVFGTTAVFVAATAGNRLSEVFVVGAPTSASDLGGIVLGGVAMFAVNLAAIVAALKIRQPHRPTRELLGGWRDNSVEVATLCLGMFATVAAAELLPLVVLMLVPVLVLHRGVLMQQLEDRARTEPKTGLLNSATWHEQVEREMARALRQSSSFGVLMVDLDHFKEINDTYGHVAGDEVLKAVATVLRTETRTYDAVGRFGGEEFVVLMPDSPRGSVIAAAERIRSRVAELRVSTRRDGNVEADGVPVPPVVAGVSASVGVAIYPDGGSDVQRVLRSADAAVYLAKRHGRNQVVTLDGPEPA
jgi:diguanylate cyclase (GGDEF)-like protein